MILERLVLTFKPEGLEARVLYRSEAKDGPGPGTKARAREVRELTRTGLKRALEALEGRVDVVGTSGFETREDTISVDGRAA
ncbi:MAG: hypothetical protein M3R38_27655 [Actinomycetota bacterium]|nr:hypothetical protein [Actinomycetota bacterium]